MPAHTRSMHAAGQREGDNLHELFFGVPARTRTRKVTPQPQPESSGPWVGRFLFIIILPLIVWSLNGILGGAVLIREIGNHVSAKAVSEALGSVIQTDFTHAFARSGSQTNRLSPGVAAIQEMQAIPRLLSDMIDTRQDCNMYHEVTHHAWDTSLEMVVSLAFDEDDIKNLPGPRGKLFEEMRLLRHDVLAHHHEDVSKKFSSAVSVSTVEFSSLTSSLGRLIDRTDQRSVWSDWFGFRQSLTEEILRSELEYMTSGPKSLVMKLSKLATISEQQQQNITAIIAKLRDLEPQLQERMVATRADCERRRRERDRPAGSLPSMWHSWNPYKPQRTIDDYEARLAKHCTEHTTDYIKKSSEIIVSLSSHAEHLSKLSKLVIALRERIIHLRKTIEDGGRPIFRAEHSALAHAAIDPLQKTIDQIRTRWTETLIAKSPPPGTTRTVKKMGKILDPAPVGTSYIDVSVEK